MWSGRLCRKERWIVAGELTDMFRVEMLLCTPTSMHCPIGSILCYFSLVVSSCAHPNPASCVVTGRFVAGGEAYPDAPTDCDYRNKSNFLGKAIHDLGLTRYGLHPCLNDYCDFNKNYL